MDSKQFKKIFSAVAQNNGFEAAFGGWFKESTYSILSIDLQKSNYGNYFELNLKIFVQGAFGKTYAKSKNLSKSEIGTFFRRQPKEYSYILDLDSPIEEEERKEKIEELFHNFISPFSRNSMDRDGIKDLIDNEQLLLLPAVKKELGL